MKHLEIEKVIGREIIDSRGNPTVEAEVILTDGTVDVYKRQVLWTPGHTAGSCCYYIPEERVLFAGDTLFQGSYGRYDLPGGNYREIQQSLTERLFQLPDDVVVFPGHMEETTIGFEMCIRDRRWPGLCWIRR